MKTMMTKAKTAVSTIGSKLLAKKPGAVNTMEIIVIAVVVVAVAALFFRPMIENVINDVSTQLGTEITALFS